MAVIRVSKTRDYTVMSNYHLRDMNLSLKAKGLLSVILSLPDNWEYTTAGLVSICKEEETAVKSALKELKTYGYLYITKTAPNNTNGGRFEYTYNIFEKPQKQEAEILTVEKQEVEILPLEILPVENHPLYKDTNKSNTKELNTDISNTDYVMGETPDKNKNSTAGRKKSKFVKPSVDEIRDYCIERGNNIDPLKFFNYYESKGWYVGKSPMKDWKACVITWELNDNTPANKPKANTKTESKSSSFVADDWMKQALYSTYGEDFEF